jgi:hypothetical protein
VLRLGESHRLTQASSQPRWWGNAHPLVRAQEVIVMSASRSTEKRGRLLLAWPRGVIQRAVTGSARLVGAGLLAAIGLIHLVLAPTYYVAAAYVGILFCGRPRSPSWSASAGPGSSAA